jgi:hypothetical protein
MTILRVINEWGYKLGLAILNLSRAQNESRLSFGSDLFYHSVLDLANEYCISEECFVFSKH